MACTRDFKSHFKRVEKAMRENLLRDGENCLLFILSCTRKIVPGDVWKLFRRRENKICIGIFNVENFRQVIYVGKFFGEKELRFSWEKL